MGILAVSDFFVLVWMLLTAAELLGYDPMVIYAGDSEFEHLARVCVNILLGSIYGTSHKRCDKDATFAITFCYTLTFVIGRL